MMMKFGLAGFGGAAITELPGERLVLVVGVVVLERHGVVLVADLQRALAVVATELADRRGVLVADLEGAGLVGILAGGLLRRDGAVVVTELSGALLVVAIDLADDRVVLLAGLDDERLVAGSRSQRRRGQKDGQRREVLHNTSLFFQSGVSDDRRPRARR